MAGESVLVVDDTPLNLKLLSVLLISRGYVVKTAISAEEALVVLATFEPAPALVLLDLRLPGMSGIDLARQLRADRAYDRVVLVAVTASAMIGDDTEALAAGFDSYVIKPVDTRTFPTHVAELLARGRAATS